MMESRCWPYVAILSGAGCFLLVPVTQAGCGIAIKADFPLVGLKVAPHYADSSLAAAAVYLLFCVVSLGITLMKQGERPGEEELTGDCSTNTEEREKNPNLTFVEATNRSTLLAVG